MRLAVTADLHWGHGGRGDAATRELARAVAELAPDVFAIAGDVGQEAHFRTCLALFAALECVRLVVPGNHDLWTTSPVVSSLEVYERRLPRAAAGEGFQYLDLQPYLAPGGREAIVGSINWYDYSFADPDVEVEVPNARDLYAAKLFPRGRHNDGQFVHLGMTDAGFCERLVERFREQVAALPSSVERLTVIQHHPPVRELFYPSALTTLDQRFWLAYTGNRRMEEAVLAEPRVRTVLCGHTHAFQEVWVGERRCLNIGGDYGWKRLLLLDTETGEERWWEFGSA